MAISPEESRYLVIGGSGFLGSYITQALVERGEKFIAVYDLARPPKQDVIQGVDYYSGDILNEGQLLDCLKQARMSNHSPDCRTNDESVSSLPQQRSSTLLARTMDSKTVSTHASMSKGRRRYCERVTLLV